MSKFVGTPKNPYNVSSSIFLRLPNIFISDYSQDIIVRQGLEILLEAKIITTIEWVIDRVINDWYTIFLESH